MGEDQHFQRIGLKFGPIPGETPTYWQLISP